MYKKVKHPILNEVLSRKPETPLYHYTTQRGLLGIISSKEIWVTHTQYLNDRRQFVHAIDLTREEVQRLLGTASPSDSELFGSLKGMERALNGGHESINVAYARFLKIEIRFRNGGLMASERLDLQ
jgi:hypothetical protein